VVFFQDGALGAGIAPHQHLVVGLKHHNLYGQEGAGGAKAGVSQTSSPGGHGWGGHVGAGCSGAEGGRRLSSRDLGSRCSSTPCRFMAGGAARPCARTGTIRTAAQPHRRKLLTYAGQPPSPLPQSQSMTMTARQAQPLTAAVMLSQPMPRASRGSAARQALSRAEATSWGGDPAASRSATKSTTCWLQGRRGRRGGGGTTGRHQVSHMRAEQLGGDSPAPPFSAGATLPKAAVRTTPPPVKMVPQPPHTPPHTTNKTAM
jgi:hypothetical protein